ncbi:hypothetical protein ACK6SQ_21030 [Enterobacter ludwigii]|uniref:hypothetical protein n=1 Tax=Enterobacter ludwigii TaxID=299767 RepID=UPI003C2B9813
MSLKTSARFLSLPSALTYFGEPWDELMSSQYALADISIIHLRRKINAMGCSSGFNFTISFLISNSLDLFGPNSFRLRNNFLTVFISFVEVADFFADEEPLFAAEVLLFGVELFAAVPFVPELTELFCDEVFEDELLVPVGAIGVDEDVLFELILVVFFSCSEVEIRTVLRNHWMYEYQETSIPLDQ